MKNFSDLVKIRRMEKKIPLRKFCKALCIESCQWSLIEEGTREPPTDDFFLKALATLLETPFQELYITAHIQAKRIPKELISSIKARKKLKEEMTIMLWGK